MKKEEFKLNEEQFFEAIEQIAVQNLLDENEIIEIIKNSVIKSFHTKFDPDAELELIIDKDKKIIKLINKTKYVIDGDVEPEYRSVEISLEDAKKINPDVKDGDVVAEEVDFATYSKQIAGQIRQLITQNVREQNKKAVYIKHKSLKGEMISAVVTSSAKSHAILQLDDGTPAFMPSKLKNPKIKLKIGERVKVYVEDILEDAKDAQIIVSNGSKLIVKRILEEEIPEILDGTVEIMSLSRQPGIRSKVSVRSTNSDIDAVGAIIGAGGSRIKTIIEKLDGEKLDVIEYTTDKNLFVANALAPAKVISIVDKKDEEGNVIEGHKIAITPNKHQTLAIGKQGMNVRLAVELTETRIDVISINEAREQGIEFTWNGNVSEQEVEQIEAGIRISGQRRNTRPSTKSHTIQIDSIDSDIQSFNEEMDTLAAPIDNDELEIINDELEKIKIEEEEEEEFSAEDLEGFEEDFDFDEAEIDSDFL